MPKEILSKMRPYLEGKIEQVNTDSVVFSFPEIGQVKLPLKYLPKGLQAGDPIRLTFSKAISWEEEKKEISQAVIEELLNPPINEK